MLSHLKGWVNQYDTDFISLKHNELRQLFTDIAVIQDRTLFFDADFKEANIDILTANNKLS